MLGGGTQKLNLQSKKYARIASPELRFISGGVG